MGARGLARPAPSVEFVRADINQTGKMAMVGTIEHQHVLSSGGGARQPDGQVVGLRAGVDEEADLQRIGQKCCKAFAVFEDALVEVAGVRGERAHLPMQGIHDAGV